MAIHRTYGVQTQYDTIRYNTIYYVVAAAVTVTVGATYTHTLEKIWIVLKKFSRQLAPIQNSCVCIEVQLCLANTPILLI